METKIITLKPPYEAKMPQNMLRMYRKSIGDTALREKWFRTSARDFKESMGAPGAMCCVQLAGKEITGFVQGYKVAADQELGGWLGGLKIHSEIKGAYFFIEKISVSSVSAQSGSEELVERILRSHSCRQTVVWVRNESREFELITRCGGKIFWSTRRIGYLMEIPAKT